MSSGSGGARIFSMGSENSKKNSKKAFFRDFLEILTKKLCFCGAHLPQKAPLKKFWGSTAKNGYLKLVKTADPLCRQGSNPLVGS